MRRIIILLSLILSLVPLKAQIDHLEPPCWWAGMKDPMVQILVHGKDISKTSVKMDYEGAEIKSIFLLENPNYLFINLYLSPDVKTGTFTFYFIKDSETVATYDYELKERVKGSSEREGFNNSDVMYLIMPDRFANGDASNDEINGMPDKLDRKNNYGRHGGDIQGIIDHLDYLDDMGFTAIWLNPVLENNQEKGAYHGYAATDLYHVDRRFGSNEDFKRLSELAREKGIKMIMDMIFNHCGSEHWWMYDIPSGDWINHYPDFVRTTHRRTVNMDPHASEYDTRGMVDGWFVKTMPDLNQRNPFMANYLIQNSIWWIEYVGLAGIRMDTYPYPDKYMMAEWNRRVLAEYPDFNIVGEEWSMEPAIVSYWQKGKINKDGYDGFLPSLMDFPLQSALSQALNEEEGRQTGFQKLYNTLSLDFLYPDPDNLVVFPDNHDMSRFYMQVGMDIGLYKLGIAYILTIRGIPQIFYGSEILMTHTESNSHGDIRKDFPGGWPGDKSDAVTGEGLSAEAKEMKEFFKTILTWRKGKAVIHHGDMMHFVPENGMYVYFRYDNQDTVLVVLNKNREETDLDLSRFIEILGGKTKGRDIISGNIYDLTSPIKVQAISPLIIETE